MILVLCKTKLISHNLCTLNLLQDKYGGRMSLMRETSKEIGDRVADKYPVAPGDVNSTYLVENMVRLFCGSFF